MKARVEEFQLVCGLATLGLCCVLVVRQHFAIQAIDQNGVELRERTKSRYTAEMAKEDWHKLDERIEALGERLLQLERRAK